jgi:FO synthase
LHTPVLRLSDAAGWARVGTWSPGVPDSTSRDDIRDVPVAATTAAKRTVDSIRNDVAHDDATSDVGAVGEPPFLSSTMREDGLRAASIMNAGVRRATHIDALLKRVVAGDELRELDVAELFTARGNDFAQVCSTANDLRQELVGDTVTYAVVRNINYTNICLYKCGFCAFSKGKAHENLRGAPYLVDFDEIRRRVREAWDRGGTEVCMQGGIHPSFTGQTYLDICSAAKQAQPDIHIHAFSPLEVSHGAQTLGISVAEFLTELKNVGLSSLPGTAAEILNDDVRNGLAPEKLTTQEWLDVVAQAHRVGLRTTSTIMFGHIENYRHWAQHLLHLRHLQQDTGGLTEFVPLPFVHMEAPMYLRGRARKGPTLREALLMHAVGRLVLYPIVPNIQASWVKLGPEWAQRCLVTGANDLGGTLMNESISRAAGASYGQELSPPEMQQVITALGRPWRQRNTLYGDVDAAAIERAQHAQPLATTVNAPINAASLRRARSVTA